MYVELHARSAFSFLEGASSPEELAGACAAHNMSSMALVDRDGLYGSPRFHLAMKKLERKAHIGAEVSCVEGGRLSLLAASREGYQNLCRLLTRMKLRSEKGKGAIRLREIREFSRPYALPRRSETSGGPSYRVVRDFR
jgi:error-prone DNA polymerase